MGKQVPEENRFAYYLGMGLMVAGCLLFLLVLVAGALHAGDFNSLATRGGPEVLGALCGVILMMVGVIIRSMGAR